MTFSEQLALGGQCLARTAREAGRRTLLGPWLALFGIELALIALLSNAPHPWVSPVMAPLVRALAGDRALRFPELFRRLPELLELADKVLAVVVLPIVTGVSVRLFERHWSGFGPRTGPAWREALASSPALVVAALPVTLVALGLEVLLGLLPGVRLSGTSRALAPRLASGLRGIVTAAFAFTPALVMLEGRGAFGSLRAVPQTWRRGFLPALLAVTAVALLTVPFDAVLERGASLIDHGAPESIALVLAGRALARALAGFLATGAITLIFLSSASPREEGT